MRRWAHLVVLAVGIAAGVALATVASSAYGTTLQQASVSPSSTSTIYTVVAAPSSGNEVVVVSLSDRVSTTGYLTWTDCATTAVLGYQVESSSGSFWSVVPPWVLTDGLCVQASAVQSPFGVAVDYYTVPTSYPIPWDSTSNGNVGGTVACSNCSGGGGTTTTTTTLPIAAAGAGSAGCETTTTVPSGYATNGPCDAVGQLYQASDLISPGLVQVGAGVVVLAVVGVAVWVIFRRVRGRVS